MATSTMDRFYSEPLDVHKWSHHPEIKQLTDRLYAELDLKEIESKSNNKRGASPKTMLRVLLLDLYVRWLKDPELSTGFQKTVNYYKSKSRYNKLFIGRKVINVEQTLEHAGYLDVLPHFNNRTGAGRSFSTRIRPSYKLQSMFKDLSIELHDIDHNYMSECIILREKFYDEEGDSSTTLDIEYDDNDYTNMMRKQLEEYNNLLRMTFIDLPSFTTSYFTREITKGWRRGEKVNISIGTDNKFVRRVFSGGVEGEWKLNGRFYGGWWQQIDKEQRRQIYINDYPTYEYDLKALHPNLLSNVDGIELPADPYTITQIIIPGVKPQQQRKYVKLLVLMAINAESPEDAFAAFRDNNRDDKVAVSLKNNELMELLNAFFQLHPHMKKHLCKGKGLELMGIDAQIANMVIDYFTKKSIAVLCIHDSFIVEFRFGEELKQVVEQATYQLTGYKISQELKNKRNTTTHKVVGNIKGFEDPKELQSHRPIKVTPTHEYIIRRDKFINWIKLSENV